MEVTVHIERADVWQVTKYSNFRVLSRALPLYLCLLILLWSVFSGLVSGMEGRPLVFKITAGVLATAMIAGPLCGLLFLLTKWYTGWRAARSPGVLGEHSYAVGPEGLREKTAVNDGLTAWQGVTSIVPAKDHLYFFAGPGLVHVIPRRAFRTQGEADQFYSLACSYWEAVKK